MLTHRSHRSSKSASQKRRRTNGKLTNQGTDRRLRHELLEPRRVLSGTPWFEHIELSADSDFETEDRMGGAMAIDGDVIVSGAPGGVGEGDLGAASIYVRNDEGTSEVVSDDTWVRLADLTGSNVPGNAFGSAVDIDGDTVVVTSAYKDIHNQGGGVYVFARDRKETADPLDDTWSQQGPLLISNSPTADKFGTRVRIDGDTIVVTAQDDDDAGQDAGAVYVLHRDSTGVWSQEAKLTASDAQTGDHFGQGIALENGTLVVGTGLADGDAGAIDTGAAYVFVRDSEGT
jgi:hypothetical protein